MRHLAIVGFSAVAAAVVFSACREHGRPDPDVRMATSHAPVATPAIQPSGGADGSTTSSNVQVPTRLEVPADVVKVYSGLRLKWRDSSIGQEGMLEVPMGKAVPIPGGDLSVRADAYLPAFTMTAEVITSTGVEEQNPAARITVLEKGKEVFSGWVFKRFPDVHPFQHPRFAVLLEGGIPRKAS
jgi:uncharacterized protein DUF2155